MDKDIEEKCQSYFSLLEPSINLKSQINNKVDNIVNSVFDDMINES